MKNFTLYFSIGVLCLSIFNLVFVIWNYRCRVRKLKEAERRQKDNRNVCNLPFATEKGIAVVAAIESGLMPEVKGGWDDTAFNEFWDMFVKMRRIQNEKSLSKQINNPFEEFNSIRDLKE